MSRLSIRLSIVLLTTGCLAALLLPSLYRQRAAAQNHTRLAALTALADGGAFCPADARAGRLLTLGAAGGGVDARLSSWQTIGGCGAGASSGTGAGIKWIGRNVSGGLFRVECQANYIDTPYGYNYVGTTLVSADLGEDWNMGVSVPYLFKHMNDPYGLGFDVRNRGLGDITGLVTYEFGPINATSLTLSVGAPTGTYDATLVRDKNIILDQDRQLGLGRPTASLTLDHAVDHLWGLSVLGGLVSWRGGENKLKSYRAPSATAYAYSSYLLGPFAPALGLQATGFTGHDRNQLEEQTSPLFSLSANASLEWSTDVVAVLIGASLPYQYDGVSEVAGKPRSPWGFGPWMVALGLAFAPL